MAVDAKERADMANFMKIISAAPVAGGEPGEPEPAAPVAVRHGTPGAGEMKRILEAFYGAGNRAAATLSDDAQYSSEVRNALVTERTPYGAKVGSWEIVVNEADKQKTYDVRNVHTGEAIASDLRLYEAAHSLVKLFNSGVSINTPRVRQILETEEGFCKNYLDAVSFRRRMLRCEKLNESHKARIAEDRYLEAKSRALGARERLRKLDREL